MRLFISVQLAALVAALSPAEVLFFRLGVPVGSNRMLRLQRTIDRTWKDTEAFEDGALLDRRIAVLESTLGADAARLIVLRQPLVLGSDLERTLAERVEKLGALLPGADVTKIIVRAPALLELDMAQTIEPRVRKLEAMLPDPSVVGRTVRRIPTLLQLADLDERLDALAELLPGIDLKQVVARAPSLLAYTPDALRRKLEELSLLFAGVDVRAMVKREPALLTYNVNATLAGKVAAC